MAASVAAMVTASGTATFTSWEEVPAHDSDPPVPRLSHATVAFAYEGDLVATSTCQYVMSYGTDGTCTFVGLERVEGSLQGRNGSFVLRHEGVYRPEGLEVGWTVVPGSGAGELAGLAGTGGYEVAAGEGESGGMHRWPWHLELDS